MSRTSPPVAGEVAGVVTLSVEGPDATGFLQGQLANDVAGLPAGGVRRSLYLNHKGHAMAEVQVVRRGRDEYMLVEEGSAGAWVKAELERHVIFDDVRVSGPTPATLVTVQAVGEAGSDAAPVLAAAFGVSTPEPERIVALAGAYVYPRKRSAAGGFDVVSAEGRTDLLQAVLAAGAQVLTPAELELARIRGLVSLAPQDAGEGVLPQEAGLHEALSYRKGCYLGQEIMARIEARGNLKRGLVRVRLADDPRPVGGDAIADGGWRELRASERVVGRLGTIAPAAGGFEALAVMRLDLPRDAALVTATGVAVVTLGG